MEAALGILGATAIHVGDGLRDDWEFPKSRAMLATLLVHQGRALPDETLQAWVWGDENPPLRLSSTLDTYATRIRRLLQRCTAPAKLRGSNGTYRLETDRKHIDYFIFRELTTVAQRLARVGDAIGALNSAEQALSLQRGRALKDVRSPRAAAWRTAFEQNVMLPANVARLSALLDLDRGDEALILLDDLQPDFPTAPALRRIRMATLCALEREDEATEYYLTTRRALIDAGDHQAATHLTRHYEELAANRHSGRPSTAIAMSHRPRLLPHDVADFVGRQELLAALDSAAVNNDGEPLRGVVLIEGMAGVGKTALAVHWGYQSRARFPDGELVINLHGYSDDPTITQGAVVDQFLTELGHEPNRATSPKSREVELRRALAGRYTLVILDNALDSNHIRDLLPVLSDCLVLVTSRRRLTSIGASYGARLVRVEPMSHRESENLLAVHAGKPENATDSEFTKLAELCGGLPLFLTVVGQNITDYRAAGRKSDMERRRELLQTGIGGDGDRTPHALMAFSYQSLKDTVRRAFRLLGLLPGPEFGARVAAACLGWDERETRAVLATLVGANLVNRSDVADRYQFHDLIRVCAHGFANDDEPHISRSAAERRILGFYLNSGIAAERALYPNQAEPPPMLLEDNVTVETFTTVDEARAWFDAERVNLVAAVALAARAGHHDYAWRLPNTIFTYFELQGQFDDCRVARELALVSARSTGELEAEISSLLYLARTHIDMGRLSAARLYVDQASRLAEEIGHKRGQISALYHFGKVEVLRGAPESAIPLLQKGLQLARSIRDHESLCWCNCELGHALRAAGKHTEALRNLREAQLYAEDTHNTSALARTLNGIGAVRAVLGDNIEAASYCEQGLQLAESVPDLPIMGETCVTLSEIHWIGGSLARAEDYARRALTLASRVHSVPGRAHALEQLAKILALAGAEVEARTHQSEALELYELMTNLGTSGSGALG